MHLTLTNDALERVVGRESVPGSPNLIRVLFEHHEPLVIRISDWLDFGLALDGPVSEDVLAACAARDRVVRAVETATRYLRLRPRTSMEVKQYLVRKGVDPDVIPDAIQLLRDTRAVDDALYTELFVDERKHHLTRTAMAWRLKERGVSPELISDALKRGVDPEDERGLALRAAQKYTRSHGVPTTREARWKLGAYDRTKK